MRSKHNTIVPIFLFLCLSSLAAGTQKPEAAAAPVSNRSYELESGDQIEIRFFYNPELNDKVEIRPDGMISMPLVGQVRVAGKTVEEFTTTLRELYRTIVKQADVTVQVRSYAGRKFIVGGDVQRPGVFPLLGSQTVLGAVMEAGGLKATSKRDKVILVRRNKSGVPEAHEIALKWSGTQLPPAATMALQPYDVVLVDESGAAKANRFIEQNITKMMPFVISAGFTYLLGGTVIR